MSLQRKATSTLTHQSTPQGILAGSGHFADLWARDALYASWGALKHGLYEPVEATLENLKSHQRAGQIPLRIGRKHMLYAMLGKTGPTGPRYTNDKSRAPALDPNTLYIITACMLINHRPSAKKEYEQSIHEALTWLATHEQEGALREAPYAGWDDSLKKRGASIYNNSLYYQALNAAGKILSHLPYTERAKHVDQAVHELLWNGQHYEAWEGQSAFDVAGNLLTIHAGLAKHAQVGAILETLDTYMRAAGHEMPKTNYPPYSKGDVYLPFRLIGMDDYHNDGPYWTWIAALYAHILSTQGEKALAGETMDALERWIGRGSIHEIYDAPGKPTTRTFYASERHFAWTAGMILYAS